ncbi:hypothetical protein [Pedobacter sp.]
MKSVEFLGSSGVGKTYMYRKLFETYTTSQYLNVRQACIKAAVNLEITFGFNRQTLYNILFGSKVFEKKKYGLSRMILMNRRNNWNEKVNCKISWDLLNKYLATEERSEVVAKRMSNFDRGVCLYGALKSTLHQNHVVVYDEGALHHHHGLGRSITTDYSFNEIEQDEILNPDGVVFFDLPFEEHMSRVIERKAKGVNTFSHGQLSANELEAYVAKDVFAYKEKITALKMLNVPVLHVQANEDENANLEQINVFLNKLNYDA